MKSQFYLSRTLAINDYNINFINNYGIYNYAHNAQGIEFLIPCILLFYCCDGLMNIFFIHVHIVQQFINIFFVC